MSMLRATWAIRDQKGELIAFGTQNIDELVTVFRKADPYDSALCIAAAIETALLNYLPSVGREDLAHDPNQLQLFEPASELRATAMGLRQ